jgi:hypothetical protein
MLSAITEPRAIANAEARLLRELRASSSIRRRRRIGFPGGSCLADCASFPELNFWFAYWRGHHKARPRIHDRHVNAFGFGDPSGDIAITVQVNAPFRGPRRVVAGGFATDERGNVVVIHRGRLGGRKELSKAAFLSAYPEPLEVMREGSKDTEVISVAVLGTKGLAAQFQAFAATVAECVSGNKREPRSERLVRSTPRGRFKGEFVGARKPYTPRKVVAEATHGAVVRALHTELLNRGITSHNDGARDLYVPGRGRAVRMLFEVKTDVEPGSIYSAIGQLFFHGVNGTRRIAVVPSRVRSPAAARLGALGIRTVTFDWRGNVPHFTGLDRALR